MNLKTSVDISILLLYGQASGPDGTRAGLPAPLYLPRKWCSLFHMIKLLLNKFVRSRWLDIGLFRFFAQRWTSTPSGSKDAKNKNKELGQYPASWGVATTLTSRILKAVRAIEGHANVFDFILSCRGYL